jgi:hypothetical protein
MLDLIAGYSLSQIIIFFIAMVLAAKGCWELIDYFKDKYKKKFNKDYDAKKAQEDIQKKFAKLFENHETILDKCKMFNEKLDDIQQAVKTTNERIDELTESDMYDIKYSIVQAYHHFVEDQKWIDDFSLSVLESRFKIYEAEGGNSFIYDLMKEIRMLPKTPPAR